VTSCSLDVLGIHSAVAIGNTAGQHVEPPGVVWLAKTSGHSRRQREKMRRSKQDGMTAGCANADMKKSFARTALVFVAVTSESPSDGVKPRAKLESVIEIHFVTHPASLKNLQDSATHCFAQTSRIAACSLFARQ